MFPDLVLNNVDVMSATLIGPQHGTDDNVQCSGDGLVLVGTTVYARGRPIDVCGALVSTGGDDEATLGGVIQIADNYYGIIALKHWVRSNRDSRSIHCEHGDLQFDDDSYAPRTGSC